MSTSYFPLTQFDLGLMPLQHTDRLYLKLDDGMEENSAY